jgi:hydrocephalus-inducing protein
MTLIGLPSTQTRQLTFKTTLGQEIVQTFKFINYLRKPTTYTCKVEPLDGTVSVAPVDPKAKGTVVPTGDFIIEQPNLNAPVCESQDGIEIGCVVKFEPSTLRESKSILKISSPDVN